MCGTGTDQVQSYVTSTVQYNHCDSLTLLITTTQGIRAATGESPRKTSIWICCSSLVMDPERIRAYLQVACAGLGFDIGEVWWTSNESGSSTVAAIRKSPSIWAVAIAFASHGHLPSFGSEVACILSVWASLRVFNWPGFVIRY